MIGGKLCYCLLLCRGRSDSRPAEKMAAYRTRLHFSGSRNSSYNFRRPRDARTANRRQRKLDRKILRRGQYYKAFAIKKEISILDISLLIINF